MNCNGPFQLKNTVVSENEYLTHVSVTFSPGKKKNKKTPLCNFKILLRATGALTHHSSLFPYLNKLWADKIVKTKRVEQPKQKAHKLHIVAYFSVALKKELYKLYIAGFDISLATCCITHPEADV